MESKQTDPMAEFRDEIDKIDGEILALLNQRMEAALKIGRLKKSRNLPVFVPQREREVLDRIVELNGGPLSSEAIEAVFQAIIGQVRSFEQKDHDSN